MKGYIYKLVSPRGKIYIGRTIDYERRMKQYEYKSKYENSPIYKEISKFGFDSFNKSIIETIEGERDYIENKLNELEAYYIKLYDSCKNGLNTKHYDTIIRKYNISNETKEKMSKSQTGRKHSLESCMKRAGANAYQSKKVHSDILNMTFDSLREAARYCGINNGCKVSECINGKRKSAGKHPITKQPITDWKYV